jgi:hypothetical protein
LNNLLDDTSIWTYANTIIEFERIINTSKYVRRAGGARQTKKTEETVHKKIAFVLRRSTWVIHEEKGLKEYC